MGHKALFCWSGGKDSAMALDELRNDGQYEIVALLTTFTGDYDRVSMHGIRRTLLEEQVRLLGYPLERVFITKDSTNEDYEARMRAALTKYQVLGATHVAFGDIFLEDLRNYRERNLSQVGLNGLFPIWKRDTKELARSFIARGFKAFITCVDSHHLDGRFAGRTYDETFLADLPPAVDPCGENGEFHSFVYDGPIFREPIPCRTGEVVLRNERFHFCDVVLTTPEAALSQEAP